MGENTKGQKYHYIQYLLYFVLWRRQGTTQGGRCIVEVWHSPLMQILGAIILHFGSQLQSNLRDPWSVGPECVFSHCISRVYDIIVIAPSSL